MIHLFALLFLLLLRSHHPIVKHFAKHVRGITIQRTMQITSPAFTNNKILPQKYTCQGQGDNPPLVFENVPKDAESLVLVVSDPDAPGGVFTHWVLFNIPPNTETIAENSYPVGAVQSVTSTGRSGYVPACPPAGTGIHHYVFTLSALDNVLVLTPNMRVFDVENAMQGHVIAKAQLIGTYPAR